LLGRERPAGHRPVVHAGVHRVLGDHAREMVLGDPPDSRLARAEHARRPVRTVAEENPYASLWGHPFRLSRSRYITGCSAQPSQLSGVSTDKRIFGDMHHPPREGHRLRALTVTTARTGWARPATRWDSACGRLSCSQGAPVSCLPGCHCLPHGRAATLRVWEVSDAGESNPMPLTCGDVVPVKSRPTRG
jgi:hypothetical protein